MPLELTQRSAPSQLACRRTLLHTNGGCASECVDRRQADKLIVGRDVLGRLRTANVDVDLVPVTRLKAHKIEHLQRNSTQINITSPPRRGMLVYAVEQSLMCASCMRVTSPVVDPRPTAET